MALRATTRRLKYSWSGPESITESRVLGQWSGPCLANKICTRSLIEPACRPSIAVAGYTNLYKLRAVEVGQPRLLGAGRAIQVATSENSLRRVYYSGVSSISSGWDTKELKDPEAGHDPIMHRDSRLLLQKLPIIQEKCIDESQFHLNFDPVEFLKSYSIIEELPIPGLQQQFLRVTDGGLTLFRSLAVLVKCLHDSGQSFSVHTPLNIGNIAISSQGKFRLRSDLVKVVPLGSPEAAGILSDFERVKAVLKELILLCYGSAILDQLPTDIHWWFHIMERAGKSDGYFICNFVALLPLRNRASAFMKLYKVLMDRNARSSRSDNDETRVEIYRICKPISNFYTYNGCNKQGWYEIATNNTAIHPWFYDRKVTYFKTTIGQAMLHRNCFAHRENSKVDVDILLYALYTDFLCTLQRALWIHGEKVCVEEDFGEMKISYHQEGGPLSAQDEDKPGLPKMKINQASQEVNMADDKLKSDEIQKQC